MTAPGRLTPGHLLTLPVVSGCALDPSGQRVAYVRTVADEAANAYRGSVRFVDLKSSAVTVLTRGVARDASPAWSADGSKLFFLSDRSGAMQLWCIELAGGEAYPLPAIDGSIGEFSVSPDGRFIAAVAVSGQGKRDVESRGWRRITRQRYRADGIGYHDSYPQIWLMDLAGGGAPRPLTDATGFVAAPAWSPDGTRIAFTGEHGADADGVLMRELWFASVKDQGAPRKLLSLRGDVQLPVWSSDGERIVCIGSDDPRGWVGLLNQRLFAADPGVGEAVCLTPSEDWTCGDWTTTDTGTAGAPFAPRFLPDGSIAVLGTQGGATRVFVVERNLRVRTATPSTMSVSMFAPYAGGFVCCASTPSTPPELYDISASGALRRLTFETKAWCDDAGVREAVRLAVDTPSGTIDAWHLPSDVPAPRPCILQIHGGPHFAYGEAFFFEFQLLAARGYDVLYCNPRGSQGYGEPFAAAILGKWGGPALADCIAALDALVIQGGTDERRLGVAGGSYGGYLTAWTISHSKRFAAAVAMRAAINLESLWGTSEVGRMLNVEMGGTPAQIPDIYRRNSPLTFAGDITTPLLLIHGERDYRCPIEQAEQLFSALYQAGKKVELMRFPEADHGLSRGGPPRQRVAGLEAILDWFDRHLV